MEVKLLSGALGAEVSGIDLTDSSDENFNKINELLLEHKVIFFRDQPLTSEQQILLAKKFGPLETHAYVKGLENFPEIVRIKKIQIPVSTAKPPKINLQPYVGSNNCTGKVDDNIPIEPTISIQELARC